MTPTLHAATGLSPPPEGYKATWLHPSAPKVSVTLLSPDVLFRALGLFLAYLDMLAGHTS